MDTRKIDGRKLYPWLAVVGGGGLLWLILRLAGPAAVGPFIANWYGLLSNLYTTFGVPLKDFSDNLNFPFVSALLLGIIGALSPCQLSTGAAALAYLSPRTNQPDLYRASVTAYVLGKVVVYSLLGGTFLLAGFEFNNAVPFVQGVRKALGPLMLLLGLHLFGLIPFQLSVGSGVSQWLEEHFAGSGVLGSFALGVAFSLAFCPTLFLLFFGLLLPLALTRPLGIVYPALFALGTTVPLLILAGALGLGMGSMGDVIRRAGKVEGFIRPAAAVVLLLAGLNDTIVYWFV